MFQRKNASSEMETAFQEALVKNAVEEQTSNLTKVAEAIDLVASAAEIFDGVGMHKEAEYMTLVLESLAAKKKKKAPKAKKKDEEKEEKASKSKKKSPDEDAKDLTSEKMEDNLKHKGWMFDVDDNASDDDNFAFFPQKHWQKRKLDPTHWRQKARHWYEQSLKAQQEGRHVEARDAFIKAEDCEDRADKLADSLKDMHVNDAKDDEFYAKDERESDLARIMHEIEETSGPDFEDEHDDWDFPMQKSRSPRRF